VTYLNHSEKLEDCRTPPLLEHHETAIINYGCSGHFLLINTPCHNKVKSQKPLILRLPNGDPMDSMHAASLDIPEMSQTASVAHAFLGMENQPLL
jgi:uncharacterized GH25 family protein